MKDNHVYMGLHNPLGYFWVDFLDIRKWGWEARRGGWHVDAGVERTKRAAIKAAREALSPQHD
jgi:hypothetical protein